MNLRVAWFTLETLTAAIGKAKADGSMARTVARICRNDLIVDLCRHREPERMRAPDSETRPYKGCVAR